MTTETWVGRHSVDVRMLLKMVLKWHVKVSAITIQW